MPGIRQVRASWRGVRAMVERLTEVERRAGRRVRSAAVAGRATVGGRTAARDTDGAGRGAGRGGPDRLAVREPGEDRLRPVRPVHPLRRTTDRSGRPGSAWLRRRPAAAARPWRGVVRARVRHRGWPSLPGPAPVLPSAHPDVAGRRGLPRRRGRRRRVSAGHPS